MPKTVQTLAATTIGISAVLPTTLDNNVTTGFKSLTFALIGEVTDLPEFGKAFNLVTHAPLATRAIQKFKGSFNEGSLTLTLARDDDDAGQVIVQTALGSDLGVAFEITYQDGDIDWFNAKVMSFAAVGGGVDSVVSRSLQIELQTAVIEEPAP